MTAPQIIMTWWLAFSVVVSWGLDGRPKTGRYNAGSMMLIIAAEAAVLWWGGFWA